MIDSKKLVDDLAAWGAERVLQDACDGVVMEKGGAPICGDFETLRISLDGRVQWCRFRDCKMVDEKSGQLIK
jgi:hypothetical protein